MRNQAYIKTPAYQRKQESPNIVGADPDIVAFSKKLVKRMAELGVPVYPHTIVRTYEDQMHAYVTGVSKDTPADGIWPHKSHAVDIIHCLLGWNLSREQWAVIGHCGAEVAKSMGIQIEWGGNWRFYDPAHFEIKNWKQQI